MASIGGGGGAGNHEGMASRLSFSGASLGPRAPAATVTDRRGRPTDGRAAPPPPLSRGAGIPFSVRKKEGDLSDPSPPPCRKGRWVKVLPTAFTNR